MMSMSAQQSPSKDNAAESQAVVEDILDEDLGSVHGGSPIKII
jgi:hypothetical protein